MYVQEFETRFGHRYLIGRAELLKQGVAEKFSLNYKRFLPAALENNTSAGE